MKKLPLLLLLLIFTAGCQNDESITPQKGFIQFSFSGNPGGKVGETPEPASVLLSLEDADGNLIEHDKKILLYSFGAGYVSESLQLKTGNYNLTKFMVLDANNKVIYATPVKGSALAYLVTDPLPIAFDVTVNGTTLVTPQVLAITESNTPENFGYVSFGFEVVPLPRLKEIITHYENITSKLVYYYDGDHISMIKIYDLSYPGVEELTHYFKFFHDASGKLTRKEFYQHGLLFDTDLYEYDQTDKLIHIDGHNDREFTYDNGKLTEVNVFPGEFSAREKTNFNYDENGNPSKITVLGYDSNNEENWTTITKYTYDDKIAILHGLPAQYFVGLTYFPTHIHDFNGIMLNHNISSINTITYWTSGEDTGLHQVYSEFEYNALGLPIKETIYNPDYLPVFFNFTGTTKEFIYE